MPKPYSMDLRQRAMARLAEGETTYEVAEALSVAVSSVIKWAARARTYGSPAPAKMGGYRRRMISGAYRELVLEAVATKPHVTLRELAAVLAAAGLRVHPASVSRFLKHEGKSFKKTLFGSEQRRQEVTRRREQWRRYQRRIDSRRLVFIDETWVKTNMAPLRGWGDRGVRLIAHTPAGHWKTMTFLAALRHDRVDAPWVINGPINGEIFRAYVRTQLLQTLKPGDIVIIDNLGSHKSGEVRKMIRAVGARLFFLPPYSPDLNPIEKLFSKFKHHMRAAMARSVGAVHDAVATALDTVTSAECSNYLLSSGYQAT
ncbi:MAG: IS630 family transposase [Terriglobia bacterium]